MAVRLGFPRLGRAIAAAPARLDGRGGDVLVPAVVVAAALLGAVLQLVPMPLGHFGHLPLTPFAPFLVLVTLGRRAASCVAVACFGMAVLTEPTPSRPLLAISEMLAVIWLGPGRGRTPAVADALFWTVAGGVWWTWEQVAGAGRPVHEPVDPTPLLLPLVGVATAGLATLLAPPIEGIVNRSARFRPPLVIPLSSVLLATLALFAASPSLITAHWTTVQIGQRLEHEAQRIAGLLSGRSTQALAVLAEAADPGVEPDADELLRRVGSIVSPEQGSLRLIDPLGAVSASAPAAAEVLDACEAAAPASTGRAAFWLGRRTDPLSWNERASACVVEELAAPGWPGWRLRLVTAPELRRDLELGGLRDLAAAALATTALALAAAIVLARRLTRPLVELGSNMDRVPTADVDRIELPQGEIAELVELGRSVMALNRDLVDQRRRAGALEAQLQRIVEHAPIGIYLLHWRPDGTTALDRCSPSVRSQLGLGHADLGGAASWLDRVHPADRQEVARVRSAVSDGRPLVHQYRLRDGSGSYRWVHDELNMLAPEPDGSRNGVGIILDIHDRRETELRLLQMSKLMALGEMATGMAHELNQPLHVIRMAIENLQAHLPGDTPGRAYFEQKLERIGDQVRRAARLADHLRAFGRQPTAEPAPFAVALMLQRVLTLTGEQLRQADIAVEVNAEPDLPAVRGAEELLDQALLNLILNARDAIVERRGAGGGGRIAIAAARAGDDIVVTVADDGGGIAPEAADHLFRPFFTTKPPGKGTGLGLSITFGIVRDMGGTITVENRDGGATFTITLPGAA